MRLLTMVLTSSAAGGAYLAARRLMADPAIIERLPAPVRAPAAALRARMLGVRELIAEGFREGRAEREAAERELTDEYHRRAQR